MQHLRLFMVVLSAILVIGAVVASAAQAEPKLAGAPTSLTASGGAGKLKSGANTIECEKNTATGEVSEGGKNGETTIKWTGCTSESIKCKSEEESNGLKPEKNGEIWIKLPVHLALWRITPKHIYAWLFLLIFVRIKCGTLSIKVAGSNGGVLLGTSLEEGKATTSTTLTGAESGGKQEITSCEEPAELCSSSPIELLSEFVEGKPESSVLVQTDTVTFAKSVTAEG